MWKYKCCYVPISVVAISLLVTISLVAGGPLHAQCTIQWSWSGKCDPIQAAIVEEIDKLKGPDGCNMGGEKCLYALKSQKAGQILATHTTPKKHYVDDLSFTFNKTLQGCSVKGYSRSETWYAVLDYGTNFCNLQNLITEAALDKAEGYKIQTDDSICTQYSSSNCTVY